MGRSKLVRFQVNSKSNNLIEPGKDLYSKIKGNWKKYFNNDHPIIVELGCGRGEYTIGLSELFPGKNFIGIDIKGSRLWKGSTVAQKSGLHNAAFLRTQVQQLENFFEKGEINEIWITFPDPKPKERDDKNRLTSPRFLNIYKALLSDYGIINFKTDNLALFEFTLKLLVDQKHLIDNLEYTYDLYNSSLAPLCYGIKTTFELKYLSLGTKINYLRCSIKPGEKVFLFS